MDISRRFDVLLSLIPSTPLRVTAAEFVTLSGVEGISDSNTPVNPNLLSLFN